jgi:hypothetical protein
VIPLKLSPELLAKLRAHRDRSTWDAVERKHDAFLIDPGLGASWITSDGRILIETYSDDPLDVEEVKNDNLVIAVLVVGAEKTRITELLDLLPPRPPDALDCPLCEGKRFMTGRLPIICLICSGRGWATRAMIDAFGPIHDYLKNPNA